MISGEEILSKDYNETLPNLIQLENNLGYMKKRGCPAAPRIHQSKKKEGYEEEYSEMVLFSPWRDDVVEFERHDEEKCKAEYQQRLVNIISMRQFIYPGENLVVPENIED